MKPLFALLLLITLSLGCTEPPLAPEASDAEAFDEGRLFAADDHTGRAEVQFASLEVFQAAGPAGEGALLDEGDTFPPTRGSRAKLLRGKDFVQVNIHTTGLPPGAYTTWWVLINETEACAPSSDPARPDLVGDCGWDEVFDIGGPSHPAVYWSTGGIVQPNGVGHFRDRTRIGEDLGEPGAQHLWGPGLTNPEDVMVIAIVKYHGAASDDPDERYLQTHTLLGLCDGAANALPNGQCFDPQWALFAPDHDD